MTIPPSTETAVARAETARGRHESTALRSAPAFDSLLKLTETLQMGAAMPADDISEEQMFEAPVSEDEQDAGQQADGGARTSMAERIVEQNDNHSDVRARRAARNAEVGPMGGQPDKETGQQRGVCSRFMGLSGRRMAGRTGDEMGRMPTGNPGRTDAGREPVRPVATPALRSSAGDGASAKADLGELPSRSVEPAAPPIASAVPTAQVKPGAGPGEGLARQVGQILATGRGGEVESPRAVVSGQSAADDTSGQSRQKAAGSAKSDQPETSGGTASSKDAEGPNRSTFERLVRTMRLTEGPYRSSAKLQLDPPELGRMNVEVRLQGDRLQIDVVTQTREARELLYDRLADLRAALEHQGLRVERFEVNVNVREEAAFTPAQDRESDHGTHGRGDGASSRAQSGGAAPAEETPAGEEMMRQEVELEAVAESRLDIRA